MGKQNPKLPDIRDVEEQNLKRIPWPHASDWIGGICLFLGMYAGMLFGMGALY